MMGIQIVQIQFCFAVLLFTGLSDAAVTIEVPDPSYNLKETQREQIVVVVIECTVADGHLCRCNLMSTTPRGGPFEVIRSALNPDDHELYYIGEVRGQILDFSAIPSWHVEVECVDSFHPADIKTQTYEIDIRKNTRPQIVNWPQITIQVDVATANIGDTVYTLQATDFDNDDIKYSILSDSLVDFFSIDGVTGAVTLEKDLKTSADPRATLELSACDVLECQEPFVLNIDFQNANEAPVFHGLHDVIIPEDTAANADLLTVVVNDDGVPPTLVPTCEVVSHPGTFDIVYDQARQVIRVGRAAVGVTPLDFESGSTLYTVTCEATDGFLTTTETITIRVTNVNEPPVFNSQIYSCLIDETNTNGGSTCDPRILVTDPEGDRILDVELVGNAINRQNQFFKYDHATGILSFRTDYDVDNVGVNIDNPVLTVEATDEYGLKSTASIEVTVQDVNDNTCSFTPRDPAFDVHQGTAVGVLGTIQATDNDRTSPNNDVTIEEESGDTTYIRVSAGGQIRYVRTIPEAFHGTTFLLTVVCKDGGRPVRSATTTVALTYMTTTVKTTTPRTTTTTTTPPTTTTQKDDDIWDDDAFVAIFAILASLLAIGARYLLICSRLLVGLYFLLRLCCSGPAGLCAGTDPESSCDCCRPRPRNQITKVKPVDDFPNSGYRESSQDYKEIGWKTNDGYEDGRGQDNDTLGPYIGGRKALPSPARHW